MKNESNNQRELMTKILKSNSRKPKFQPYYCVSHRSDGNRWRRQRTRSENNAEIEEPMSQDNQLSIIEYGHKMDCEVILEKSQMEMDSNANAAANTSTTATSTTKELIAAAKMKRSKSLDNLILKTSQDLNRNSSTLEFPSILSRFSELQFKE